jgi:small GTP-binding protein
LITLAKLVWKIVIIGDPAVGKTSIRRKYLGETTLKEYIYTIGADFATKRIKLTDDLTVQYQIFDLAGQQKFDKVRSSFYSGSKAAILVYDITDNQTLENIPKWVKETKRNSENSIQTFVVVGNKIDLREQKDTNEQLLKHTIEQLSKDMGHGILHVYTSALTGENIELLFEKVTEKLLTTAAKESAEIAKLAKKVELSKALQKEKEQTKTEAKVKTAPIQKAKEAKVDVQQKRPKKLDERIALIEKEIEEMKEQIQQLQVMQKKIAGYLKEHQKILKDL